MDTNRVTEKSLRNRQRMLTFHMVPAGTIVDKSRDCNGPECTYVVTDDITTTLQARADAINQAIHARTVMLEVHRKTKKSSKRTKDAARKLGKAVAGDKLLLLDGDTYTRQVDATLALAHMKTKKRDLFGKILQEAQEKAEWHGIKQITFPTPPSLESSPVFQEEPAQQEAIEYEDPCDAQLEIID